MKKESVTFLYAYVEPNNRTSKYMKQKLTSAKRNRQIYS